MPVSSDRVTRPKTVGFAIKGIKGEPLDAGNQNNNFLTIASALPILPGVTVPPNSTESSFNVQNDKVDGSNTVTLQWTSEGKTVMATGTAAEKKKSPDRQYVWIDEGILPFQI